MSENMSVRRGDLFFADLNPVQGSEQGGLRPVIIVQNNIGNRYSPTTIIAPLTTNVDKKQSQPTHYQLPAVSGLQDESIVLLEQIRTIDKSRLLDYIGHLDYPYYDGLNHALSISVGIPHAMAHPMRSQYEKPLELCLCPSCASPFYDDPNCRIFRKNPYQVEKEQCTYCNSRYGYDFIVKRFVHQTKTEKSTTQRGDA